MWIDMEALDIAIATNSYNEFIGICHEFILDKQGNLNSNFNLVENEFNIKNLIITARKGRPVGRAKSFVEIQKQHIRKCQNLQPLNNNNQNINVINNASDSINETNENN
ncbi:hypothetical protein C1645_834455 [Glomus cerebriforme]|uniref:Uncharacterized protein n=1 Tax=Glomus cerebriforme TaxID=658196 RepID=A0A397SGA1_9GLOM|nr:hypothetical protein C1645_834455 [Glomus cerebriforme]